MKKKTAAILLCSLLALAVAGCGKSGPAPSQEKTKSVQDAEPSAQESVDSAAGTGTSDESLYAALEPRKIKIVSTSLEGEEPTPEIQKILQEITEKSGGKITFDLTVGGSTLFGESEMYDMLKSGSIDLCNVAPTQFSDVVPEMSVCCWPYVFESADNINQFWTGEDSRYLKDKIREDSDIVVLTTGFTGVRNLTTKGIEVKSPDDLKGVKIRCMDSKIYVDGTNAMGATAVPIAWSELYFALQTGVVDGQENANTVIEAGSLYEVQDILTLTEHLYSMSTFAANGTFWDSLPAEYQDLIRSTFTEHFIAFPEKLQKDNDALLKKFEDDYGMKVVKDVDKEAFIKVCGEAFMKEFGNDDAFVKMYNAIKNSK